MHLASPTFRSGPRTRPTIPHQISSSAIAVDSMTAGTRTENPALNGIHLSADDMVDRLDEIGSAKTYSEYPVGWAHAMNTPFQWTKIIASHLGGTRQGLIVRWPAGIANGGELRHQWH